MVFKLKQNEGMIDRIIRVGVGIGAFIVGFTMLEGVAQIVAYIIGLAGVVTGLLGYCHLYTLLGIKTKK